VRTTFARLTLLAPFEVMTDADHSAAARRVADNLRDAFATLSSTSLTDAERVQFQRRLLAITTTSKRDIARAQLQLDRLQHDLEVILAAKDSSQS